MPPAVAIAGCLRRPRSVTCGVGIQMVDRELPAANFQRLLLASPPAAPRGTRHCRRTTSVGGRRRLALAAALRAASGRRRCESTCCVGPVAGPPASLIAQDLPAAVLGRRLPAGVAASAASRLARLKRRRAARCVRPVSCGDSISTLPVGNQPIRRDLQLASVAVAIRRHESPVPSARRPPARANTP